MIVVFVQLIAIKSVQSSLADALPIMIGNPPKGSSLDRAVCCNAIVMTSTAPDALAHKCAGKTFAPVFGLTFKACYPGMRAVRGA